MKKIFFSAALVAASLFGLGSAEAALLSVVDTGTAGSNSLTNAVGKWTLQSVPSGSGYSSLPVNVTTLGGGWYVPGINDSQWISINANQGNNAPFPVYASGVYAYRTEFTFNTQAGYVLQFDAKVYSDNQVEVKLNDGTTIATSGGTDLDGDGLVDNYVVPLTFSLTADQLQEGTNHLVFRVTNGPWNGLTNNPTGLNVDFTSSYTLVPEPASMAIWGVAGFATLMLRRRKRAA